MMNRDMNTARSPRSIAIGDIHGCSRALRMLVEAFEPQRDDLVIPLGDVIDRGPDARGTIEMLMELQGRCCLKPVLGNHEEMMLSVLEGAPPERWIWAGGASTLDSYGFVGSMDVVPTAHIDFLRSFSDFVETATHFFVHANFNSRLPLTQQPRRSIRSTTLKEHLPAPHVSGKVAVVGHTPDRGGEIFTLPHLKCIDTYCYGGGWLTAYEAVSGQVWQANQKGELRSQVIDELVDVEKPVEARASWRTC